MGKENINSSPTVAATNNDHPLAQHSFPSPLILGSASFTRKLILREMEIPFHILVRPIDEKSIGDRSASDRPEDLVLMVARAKMNHLVDNISRGDCDDDLPATSVGDSTVSSEQEFVILTGDQVITCGNRILEKPESVEEAKQFVRMYATNPPSTVGSVILTHLPSGITVEGTDKATIYFKESVGQKSPVTTDDRETSEMDLVDRMLFEDAPILSCAGGLMIEHPLVREHIDRIDGTEDSVMGLSKALVLRLLGELKVKLNEQDQSKS
jgi:septum formation protein